MLEEAGVGADFVAPKEALEEAGVGADFVALADVVEAETEKSYVGVDFDALFEVSAVVPELVCVAHSGENLGGFDVR